MTNCLFCSEPEPTPGYRVSNKDVEFVCSGCVQILLDAEQLHLRRAHEKAVSKGYESKARAIESFLIPEENDGKRPAKRNRKNLNRKGITRTLGNQAKRIGRFAA
jgi:hypothetical protein